MNYAKEFSTAVGCNQLAKNEILSCLQDQDVSTIMTTKVDNMLVYPWTPILDHDFTTDPYLESKNIEHSFESGQFNTDLEIMIGTTADEGIFFIHDYVTGRKNWEDLRNNIDTEGASHFFNIANKAEITSDVKGVSDLEKCIDYFALPTRSCEIHMLLRKSSKKTFRQTYLSIFSVLTAK